MSRTARVTGAILSALVIAMIFGGWRLYDFANPHSPESLGEQLIAELDKRSFPHARALLDQGADPKARNRDTHRTCLMAAANAGDPVIVQRLLQRGANVDATDYSGNTALGELLAGGHATPALVKMLLPKPHLLRRMSQTGYSPLAYAVNTKDIAIANTVLDAGANPNDKALSGEPLLAVAVAGDDVAMVKALVAHGASVNAKGLTGESTLHIAQGLDDDALAQYLIAHGADVNRADTAGNSPLMSAVANNLPGAFGALLGKGARVNAKNKKGETALIVAAREDRLEMVVALLKRHADTAARDATTRTAKAWAKDQGFTDIERTLSAHALKP